MSALLGWFTGKQSERRAYPRRKVVFRAAFATGAAGAAPVQQFKPAIGIDISGGGVLLLLPEELKIGECDIKVALAQRTVKARVSIVWFKDEHHHGKRAWRYGMRFVGISADDWDAIIRFVGGQSVEQLSKAREEMEAIRLTPDDAARLIPSSLQNRMLAMLVAKDRLAAIDPKVIPLVQYSYSGIVTRGGKNMHRLTIASRVRDLATNEMTDYETRFFFSEDGKELIMEPR